MSMYPTKAPHQPGARDPLNVAPNAALLIDFDNVTMGMRSDLSKELKTLLNSDIIKGKVTVQRAYADWRRYPQYIVPLSEASIDLIFAPAYGSNKKNATDIRMAIDGIELVFIRPEIGTYILLTGDSDFSSLVLKLKEYGKYVIGVGIQESSSDILVQNCDEYYSYTSLSGLRRTSDSDPRQAIDPWVLVERAVEQMAQHDDVMRSDRLKQVMVELDPGFDEGEYGFSKFSRFVTEASGKGLLTIRKLDNGQFEVAPGKRSGGRRAEEPREERPRPEERGRPRAEREEERRERAPRSRERAEPRERAPAEPRERAPEPEALPVPLGAPLDDAYGLLRRALERLAADGKTSVRDSDVKRKMLELDREFDETNLGFSKFSRFLRQAQDHEVVELHKQDTGNYEVSLRSGQGVTPAAVDSAEPAKGSAVVPAPPAPVPALPGEPESVLGMLGRRFGFLLGGTPKRPTTVTAAPPAEPPAGRSPEARPQATARGEGAGPSRREPQRGRELDARTPEARADREERERQRRFHEAESARETGAGSSVEEAPQEASPVEPSSPRERGERRGRGGQRGEGRGRRGSGERTRGEGRGEGAGVGRGERGERGGRSRSGRSRRDPMAAETGPEEGAAVAAEGAEAREVVEAGFEPRAAPVVEPGPEPEAPAPSRWEPPRTETPSWTTGAESPAAEAPPPAEPSPEVASAPMGATDEFAGLEPSRLHTRTKRRGPRR